MVTICVTKLNTKRTGTFPIQFIRVLHAVYITVTFLHSFNLLICIIAEQYVLCAAGIELSNTECSNYDTEYMLVLASRPKIAQRLNVAYRATCGEDPHYADQFRVFRVHRSESSLCQPLKLCLVFTTHIHVPYFIWQLLSVTSRRFSAAIVDGQAYWLR